MCFRIVAIVVMNHVINSHFFLKISPSTAQLRPRIVSRSIRGVNNEGSVGYLAADEPRSVDSAVSMMCRDSSITNATTRQSTVRWRRSMARGARSVSTPARGLSQAGCCVRAVDVVVMVDVSSVGRRLVFFGRRGVASREGGRDA